MSWPCFHQRSRWLLPLPCAWQLVPDQPHPDGDLGLKNDASKQTSFLLGPGLFSRGTCDFCAVGSQNLLLASCFLVGFQDKNISDVLAKLTSNKYKYFNTWNSKQPVFDGCSTWMIPNHYTPKRLFRVPDIL